MDVNAMATGASISALIEGDFSESRKGLCYVLLLSPAQEQTDRASRARVEAGAARARPIDGAAYLSLRCSVSLTERCAGRSALKLSASRFVQDDQQSLPCADQPHNHHHP